MKEKKAKELLYDVLRAMWSQSNGRARSQLQRVGEALLGESKDLSFKKTQARINELAERPHTP